MAEVAHGVQHDFWRPPTQTTAPEAASQTDLVEACDGCKAEFIVGSRYCHNCGATRSDVSPTSRRDESLFPLTIRSVAVQLELPTGAFVAFALGIFCVLGAIGVGAVYSVRTVLDWQAVQLWRIEWLLGAVAAFVAGCLLKRSR
jgi:hypothetical protein